MQTWRLIVYLADCLVTKETLLMPLVIRHVVSVSNSEIIDPNEVHTVTITVIIFTRLFLDLETMPASSA